MSFKIAFSPIKKTIKAIAITTKRADKNRSKKDFSPW